MQLHADCPKLRRSYLALHLWAAGELRDSAAVEFRFATLHRFDNRRAPRSGYQPVGATALLRGHKALLCNPL